MVDSNQKIDVSKAEYWREKVNSYRMRKVGLQLTMVHPEGTKRAVAINLVLLAHHELDKMRCFFTFHCIIVN